MVETMDLQARDELYRQIARAKEKETKLELEIESLKKELSEFKGSIVTEMDEAPTWKSDKLLSSGAVYEAIQTLNRKIDSIK